MTHPISLNGNQIHYGAELLDTAERNEEKQRA